MEIEGFDDSLEYNGAWTGGGLPTIDEQVKALGLSTLVAAKNDGPSNGNSGGASAQVDVKISWDHTGITDTSAGFSGKAYDSHGNNVQVSVSHNSQGQGEASLSAGSEWKGDKDR